MAPLITHLYTADPSAHVFNGRVYIYPSHDRETATPANDEGDQYDMADYHVFSTGRLADPPGPVTDHGAVLRLRDVPWASRQLWAPDAARDPRTGRYHLFFPARDRSGRFRIGVAVGEGPEGPFAPDEGWIPGTFSVDPAVLVDDDGEGSAYLYFGGLWGGQLQCYQGQGQGQGRDGREGEDAGDAGDAGAPAFDESWLGPKEPSGPGVPALGPRVARLAADMRTLDSPSREVSIVDPETRRPLAADDHARRFFEAAWCHKRRGRYYLSWSTGDTHRLCWAVGDSAWGPFEFGGEVLGPVSGWTTHHSIVEFGGRWWLFYHDCELSGGVDHLRCVHVREIFYDSLGRIVGERPE